MCGINGIVQLRNQPNSIRRDELVRTRDYMKSRGPDGVGEWFSPNDKVGLGHRRLAIIDLSSSGAQPMPWQNGRYRIVFNGEIFNYRELRNKLERTGVQFNSQSDTEVLLALYAQYGPEMLGYIRGMYAFAIWDNLTDCLFLARDPLGIKPLYYSTQGGYFRFASQVKALEACTPLSGEVDPAGVVGFLLWGSVPEPFTFHRAIRALPAGHFLKVERGEVGLPCEHEPVSLESISPQPGAVAALQDTVRAHLVADVPVAIFLSAGLDSSMLTALACRHLPSPPITFTLRFESFVGTEYDEAPLAATVAKKMGTRHIECTVRPRDFPDLFEHVTAAMDQPSIDGFNTYVVSQSAHQAGLKVVLSGLGGDELFGSYASFQDVPRWHHRARQASHIPGVQSVFPKLARRFRSQQPKLAGLMDYGRTLSGAYFLRRGLYLPEELPKYLPPGFVQEGLASYDPLQDANKFISSPGTNHNHGKQWQVHVMETTQYMRNQLLRDADWASMAHSLELRVPFVDSWLHAQFAAFDFEPAWSQGKAALARQVAPELPDDVFNRPKSGFAFPIMEWLESGSAGRSGRRWGLDSRRLALQILGVFDDQLVLQ